VLRWLVSLSALVVVLAACDHDDEPGAPPPDEWASCVNDDYGWEAEHPAGWEHQDCWLFDPEPVEVTPGTEIPTDIAVQLRVEPTDLDAVLDDPFVEVLDRQEVTVDGRPGFRDEQRHTGEALYPADLRSVRYAVELADGVLVGVTFDVGEPDFTTTVDVLDDMMDRLRLPDDPDEGVEPMGEASLDPKASDDFPADGPTAELVDVRVARQDGFDRFVLEFEADEAPSWQVDWEETPIRADPSGIELEVDGRAFLAVSVHPATAVDLTGSEPEPTYDGPDRIRLDGSVVTEVVLRTDHHRALGWVIGLEREAPFAVALLSDPYRLVVDVVVPDEGAGPDGAWAELAEAPIEPRLSHSATWSGDRLLVWGGGDGTGVEADGAAWEPTSEEWRVLPAAPIEPRWAHEAAWTGDRLLVWGGTAGPDHLAECFTDGALYDPVTGTWEAIPPAPDGMRCNAAVAWTGDELLVVGGFDDVGPPSPGTLRVDGVAFDPATGEWRDLSALPVVARYGAVSAWTGDELLVWGGTGEGTEHLGDGAAYDPVSDTWRQLASAPLGPRSAPLWAWTGEELVIAGGQDLDAVPADPLADAAAYDPAADEWRAIAPLPAAVDSPGEAALADGWLFVVGQVAWAWDARADAWSELAAPPGGERLNHTMTWTGDELLVWGGQPRDGDPVPFVTWRPAAGDAATIEVFFTPGDALDQDCSVVEPVSRSVAGPADLEAALGALLGGPSDDEEAAGLTSWFSDATAGGLRSVEVRDGVAHVGFADFSGTIPNASTSCGSAMLLAQLDATVTAFDGVDRAVYSFDGDVDAFYEWLQLVPPEQG
jgi:hypothetical protein